MARKFLIIALVALAMTIGVVRAANNPYGIVKGLNGNWAIVDCYSAGNQKQSCTEHWVIGAGSQDPVAGFGSDGDLFWRTDLKAFRTRTAGIWGGAGATFPVTEVSGDTTIQILSNIASKIASFYIYDDSDGTSASVGLNGTPANLGVLSSAFVGAVSAVHSVAAPAGLPEVQSTVDNGTNSTDLNVLPTGVKLTTTGAKPTCDAASRGSFWIVQGGGGVADTVEVCSKDAGGSYAWRTLI